MTIFKDLENKVSALPENIERYRIELLLDTVKSLLAFRNQDVELEAVRDILPLEKLYGAYKASLPVTDKDHPAYLSDEVKTKLLSYLTSLHGFNPDKDLDQQDPIVQETYGYSQMALTKMLLTNNESSQ